MSFYINAILEEYFDEYEHAYFIKSEAEEIRAGRAMSYSINSVKTELGITVWILDFDRGSASDSSIRDRASLDGLQKVT